MIITYNNIISLKNLYQAWEEFVVGKKYKKDVSEFSLNLSFHIMRLHEDLKYKTYSHGKYKAFSINDPKPRSIHKSTVRDRLLHHAVYRILYPYFEEIFVYDSYSCRYAKGTHRALDRFTHFQQKVSKNNHKTCWVLKCDIRKFFASIDQTILTNILTQHISDTDVLWLLSQIISSFHSTKENVGLPLGNLTSQLLVNIYLNQFDQYMKHELKVKYYIRYADDFVIMSEDKSYLLELLSKVGSFLKNELLLTLHPDKIFIKTLASGVDFLGWVHFPYHRVLRTATKKRMIRNLKIKGDKSETVESYKGMLKHGNTYKLRHSIGLLSNWV
jgi:retron-type reverse transcriptase